MASLVQRVVMFMVVAAGLIGLIVYSQYRPPLRKVSGYLESHEIRLGSQVGGRVAEVLCQEGDAVRKGELLVRLEPFDLLEQQQEANATLAARQAELDKLEQGYRDEEKAQAKARYDQLKAHLELLQNGPLEQEKESARAQLKAADAELQLARQSYDRSESLFRKNAATREELDRDTERLRAAEAMVIVRQQQVALLDLGTRQEELEEARAKLEEARQAWELTKKGYRTEEIQQARAARDAARAALEAIGQRLGELQIHSPVTGVVEAMELQPGDLVSPGGPALSILDQSHLWIRSYVPQNYLGLAIGQRLPVTIDAFPNESFSGTVEFISRQAEFSPTNVQTPEERAKQVFRIKVAVSDTQQRLRPGMTGDIWLDGTGGAP